VAKKGAGGVVPGGGQAPLAWSYLLPSLHSGPQRLQVFAISVTEKL